MSATHQTAAVEEPMDGHAANITVVRVTDAITALELEGEFDIAESPRIADEADRLLREQKHLIIDLSAATFIDSSVIHTLFRANAGARQLERCLVLQLGTAAGVKLVLDVTGADRTLKTATTREQAVALMDGVSSAGDDDARDGTS